MQDKNTTSNQITDGSLTSEQKARYARHLMLPQIGESGQEKINSTSVLVVGAGGLGSPVLMYLAAAGIGHLIVSDFDRVEDSNLQRQIIHRTQDIGELKAISAKRTIAELNPDCVVEALDWQLDDDEFDISGVTIKDIQKCIDNRIVNYNHQADKSEDNKYYHNRDHIRH